LVNGCCPDHGLAPKPVEGLAGTEARFLTLSYN
jgi:hypothetical protein